MLLSRQRYKYASRLAAIHLGISILVAAISACIVWLGWYKEPFASILDVSNLYQVIIIVDVICGPLLTLILSSPTKSGRETFLDLVIIAFIQLGALAYGMYALYTARPVVIAYEKDRYVIVRANEVPANADTNLPQLGIRYVNIREPKSREEKELILGLFLQGFSVTTLPDWWQDHKEAAPLIDKKAKPLSQLLKARPAHSSSIQLFVKKHSRDISDLRFLPFIHAKNMTWIVVIDDQQTPLGYLNIDGFI